MVFTRNLTFCKRIIGWKPPAGKKHLFEINFHTQTHSSTIEDDQHNPVDGIHGVALSDSLH